MQTRIELYEPRQRAAVVGLSLRAWSPVFHSLRDVMAPEVYAQFYPDGWEAVQRGSVESTLADPSTTSWVALDGDTVTGFVSLRLHAEDALGEIYMIAVDPEAQRRGIASALTQFSLDWMKEHGAELAMVETGGDPGHAPARATYEKMGFGSLPVARYFKKL